MSLSFQTSFGEEGLSAPLADSDSSTSVEYYNLFQNQSMFPDEAAIFVNSSASQSPIENISHPNWQSKWISSPDIASPTDLHVDFNSSATLLPSPPPSSPASGRSAVQRSGLKLSKSISEIQPIKVSSNSRSLRDRVETSGRLESLKRQRQDSPRRLRPKQVNDAHDNADAEVEDEDDEDDEEYVPVPTRRGRGKRVRQPHSIVEQRYRNSLNAEIRRLQMAIPHLAEFQHIDNFRSGRPQPTKATIIASAVQYIKSIETERDALIAAERARQKVASWR